MTGVQTCALPIYRAVVAPHITTNEALSRAIALSQGKVDAARIGLVTQGDIVAWTGGNVTTTISADRVMYLVALKTVYVPTHGTTKQQPCTWLAVAVDAVDGTVWSIHCGPESWPPPLPGTVLPVNLPSGTK